MGKTAASMTANEYQEQAQVTCSNMFFGEYVNIKELIEIVNNAIVAINALDKAKKLLFYGRGISDIPEPKLHELKRDPFGTLGSVQMTGADERIIHALIGAPTEAGELLEILRDALYEKATEAKRTPIQFDKVKLMEEFGGMLWYAAIGLEAAGTSLEQCFGLNIAQLRARFKDKFDAHEANNRNLKLEKSVMSSLVGVATPETYLETEPVGPTADDEIERFIASDPFVAQSRNPNFNAFDN